MLADLDVIRKNRNDVPAQESGYCRSFARIGNVTDVDMRLVLEYLDCNMERGCRTDGSDCQFARFGARRVEQTGQRVMGEELLSTITVGD